MRKILICLLVVLAACQAQEPAKTTANATNITLQNVLDEFEKLDAQLNTTWKQERIPDKLIDADAIEPWTANMIFLKDRLANDELLADLVQSRIEMLRAQLAYHLMSKVGEDGVVETEGNVTHAKVIEKIDCTKIEKIQEFNRLFRLANKYYLNFVRLMDEVLQRSPEAKAALADDKRIAFYDSKLGNVEARTEAIKNAVQEECGYELALDK